MGPLEGLRIVEFAGIGPGPFCAMMLADLGADVVRVDRAGGSTTVGLVTDLRRDLLNRGRRSITLDLKNPADVETALRLVEKADALIEGLRPGVMERLGLGPDVCLARNRRLVYGRMTGWGQTGPLAKAPGHDLNYLGLTGALHAMGPADAPPAPPLNLVADFGGGGMLLAFGLLAAIHAAQRTGEGQIVDAAMIDGVAAQTAMFRGIMAQGGWTEAREANLLDGGAPFYRCYACADGLFVAMAPLEPQFFAAFLERAGLGADPDFARQYDRSTWPRMRARLAAFFAARPRDDWAALFDGTDACVTPVLTFAEATRHPHAEARAAYVARDGVSEPAPAPRFSGTPAALELPPPLPGEHSQEVLRDWGVTQS